MDEDKRQIRMFKEMYLADGEMHSKEARRKQFRWKNVDGINDSCLLMILIAFFLNTFFSF